MQSQVGVRELTTLVGGELLKMLNQLASRRRLL